MKSTRLFLAMAVMGVGLLGAFWAASAQDGRPLFAPPAILPREEKPPARFPLQTQPLRGKPKGDPTLIVPPEVREEPRPIGPMAKEGVLGVVQVDGTEPLPLFPPLPPADKGPSILPSLPASKPALEPLPMPVLEPTKALIVEPKGKDRPANKTAPLDVPLAPLPALPGVKVEPSVPAAQPRLVEKPRAFVRIESAASSLPPPIVSQRPLVPGLDLDKPFSPPPLPTPMGFGLSGLVNLQTPSVTIEKRGQSKLRALEAQAYQIVVRNLGPAPAQQVRIEDDLPANLKIVSADPMPIMEGTRAVWLLSNVNVNQEQTIRLTVQAAAEVELQSKISVHVSTSSQPTTTTALRPRIDGPAVQVQLTGPTAVSVGKPAVFEIRVANTSAQPLTSIVLYGWLPDGLSHPEGAEIKGEVETTVAPGETKTLKMPTTAVKRGRYAVRVKVATNAGDASAATEIDIASEALHITQAPATRLFPGRDGELRIEVTNHTGKTLRNVQVADRLPDGVDFVDASHRGLYQANNRVVYWLIDQLPADKAQTLVVRVHGNKAGEHQNVAFVKADGIPELQSKGLVVLEGVADLSLRVVERDNPLELGKQTVYEVVVQNAGHASATQVKLQVDFPPGMTPTKAEGEPRFNLERQSVIFEPIGSLGPQGQATFRVTALAQAVGDQRVRFSVVSEQVRVPLQREISVKVYP